VLTNAWIKNGWTALMVAADTGHDAGGRPGLISIPSGFGVTVTAATSGFTVSASYPAPYYSFQVRYL
jgi:hypothetical protein